MYIGRRPVNVSESFVMYGRNLIVKLRNLIIYSLTYHTVKTIHGLNKLVMVLEVKSAILVAG